MNPNKRRKVNCNGPNGGKKTVPTSQEPVGECGSNQQRCQSVVPTAAVSAGGEGVRPVTVERRGGGSAGAAVVETSRCQKRVEYP